MCSSTGGRLLETRKACSHTVSVSARITHHIYRNWMSDSHIKLLAV